MGAGLLTHVAKRDGNLVGTVGKDIQKWSLDRVGTSISVSTICTRGVLGIANCGECDGGRGLHACQYCSVQS